MLLAFINDDKLIYGIFNKNKLNMKKCAKREKFLWPEWVFSINSQRINFNQVDGKKDDEMRNAIKI